MPSGLPLELLKALHPLEYRVGTGEPIFSMSLAEPTSQDRDTVYLYHRTDAARSIESGEFRNGSGTYFTNNVYEGVWVADQPLDINEGAVGKYVMTIEVPSDFDLQYYEWQEDGKGYRKFLIPAEVLNGFPIIAVEEDDWNAPPDWDSLAEELRGQQGPIDLEPLSPSELEEAIRKRRGERA
jgi:hypothetical protein